MTHRIIFDTDPGIDDAMALAFAQASSEVEVLGITTTFGNATIEQTTRNALLLADALGIDAPVHRGAARPLEVEPDAPPHFVHGWDGLGDAGLEMPPAPDEETAVDFIIDTVRAHPGEVSLVAVGRQTNLARVAMKAPDVVDLVREVVIMGGCLGRNGIHGNISPCAEANIHGDPHAADIVMTTPWPLTMVGLDVTMLTRMTPEMVADVGARGGDAGALLERIARFYQAFYERTSGYTAFPVHDSSAVACLIAPELYRRETGAVRVVSEGLAMGQTLFAEEGRFYAYTDWSDLPRRQVCVDVDADAVLELYISTLTA